MKKLTGTNLTYFALAFFVIFAGVSCFKDNGDKKPKPKKKRPAVKMVKDFSLENITACAWDFREYSLNSYASGLKVYATDTTKKKFARLNGSLWPATDPVLGWSFFFNTSLIYPFPPVNNESMVAFYNPWSDVFLVTVWKKSKNGAPIITDAEVITGGLVRKNENEKLSTARLWTTKKLYAPYSVGTSTVETIKSFEHIFSKKDSFRNIINGLYEEKLIAACHIAAGKQMMENFADMSGFLSKKKEAKMGELARTKLAEMTELIERGQINKILKEAYLTPSESKKAFSKLTIKEWETFKLASYQESQNKCVIMLVKGDRPDVYLGIMIENKNRKTSIRRLDLLNFQKIYENYDSIKAVAK